MTCPQFIAIDASSFEDSAHPVAIAWSLADGSIKTTLIQPDDDWQEDWDYAIEDLHGINRDTLFQRGETCWSVIRELENDIEQSFLFADDEARVQQMLVLLYESCNREPNLEAGHYAEVINRSDMETTPEPYHQTCDDRVYALLMSWANANPEAAMAINTIDLESTENN